MEFVILVASIPDTGSSVAVFVSLLSFMVAALTLYFNVLSRPHLKLVIGKSVGFQYTADNHLFLDLDLVVLNDGAKQGVLSDLSATIARREAEQHTGLGRKDEWRLHNTQLANVYREQRYCRQREPFTPKQEFAGWVMPLSVPGHEAVTKRIRFRTSRPFSRLASGEYERLSSGEYNIEVVGTVNPSRGRTLKGKLPKAGTTVRISPDDIEKLSTYLKEGVSKESPRHRILYKGAC